MKLDNFLLNYFRPNATLDNLSEVTKDYLLTNKIKLIICDLDNTLVPHFSFFPNSDVIDFLTLLKSLNIKVYIASNNSKKRVVKFMNVLPKNLVVNFIWNAKKPLTRKISKFVKEIHAYPSSEVLVIGDQFVTDIWYANRMKFRSLLLLPEMNTNKKIQKNFFIKILDNMIYKHIQHKNLLIPINKKEDKIRII